MFKAIKNWFLGGSGTASKQAILKQANAAPYKVELPVTEVVIPVVVEPEVVDPVIAAEKPKAKRVAKPKVATEKAPRKSKTTSTK